MMNNDLLINNNKTIFQISDIYMHHEIIILTTLLSIDSILLYYIIHLMV